MTKQRYPHPGCAAWSQVYGEAAAWSSASAWNVNFNNGNVNNNHRNNNGFALAVRRAGEFQGDRSLFQQLYDAWRKAHRQKVPSHNQLRFDARWLDGLLQMERELLAGTWRPRPSTCFIATRPKAREIHAPDFADRVVHHWLVPQLEAVYEPAFIFDSYANRRGKGSHAAVRRAQAFARQVHSGQGGGWYLQLDIHNFFNCIHRPTLWSMLKQRLVRAALPALTLQVTHALLCRPPLAPGVRVRATAAELAQVPTHKRLINARPGCGLPIGNLSSQFFANVYLDALDQFVKHTLKARRYLRYVDDFVLFHRDRAQLQQWLSQIETFLAARLQLTLKPDIRLRRVDDGLDFSATSSAQRTPWCGAACWCTRRQRSATGNVNTSPVIAFAPHPATFQRYAAPWPATRATSGTPTVTGCNAGFAGVSPGFVPSPRHGVSHIA